MLTKVLVGSVITADRFRETFLEFLHLGQRYHEQKAIGPTTFRISISEKSLDWYQRFPRFAKFQRKLTPAQTMP
jgi:hypothetical protein